MYNDIEGAKVPRMLPQYMQSELSFQRVNILDCLVLNLYAANEYIQWHTDDNVHFDTQYRKVEILSIFLGADGVFCVQPQPGSQGASHSSAVLMNGWFQTE